MGDGVRVVCHLNGVIFISYMDVMDCVDSLC